MFKIQILNHIASVGLDLFPHENYEVASELTNPDAILLRSFDMHKIILPRSLKAVGRAGAGTNNIPVAKLTEQGIPVFNTPGANANAVKELVLASMFIACRNICDGWQFARALSGDDATIDQQVENQKKQFAGFELTGRVLGVIGLGAIGGQVANAAVALGMQVIGYDPKITVERAWELSSSVQKAASIDEVLSKADIITLHIPLLESTRHMIDASRLQILKNNSVLINFSRAGLVDERALTQALDENKLHKYVTDFPTSHLNSHSKVVALPHLGASTEEAEQNCARMAVQQLRDYLENGNIRNSVNFPEMIMPREAKYRLAIVNKNIPNMVGQISTCLAKQNLNILDMLNKSREEIAYNLIDVNTQIPDSVVEAILEIDGVLSIRLI